MMQNAQEQPSAHFTRKRLKVSLRLPMWPVPDPTIPYVMAEAEDGSGVAVAIFGPESPVARADAQRMVELWNSALDNEHAAGSGRRPSILH